MPSQGVGEFSLETGVRRDLRLVQFLRVCRVTKSGRAAANRKAHMKPWFSTILLGFGGVLELTT